MYHKHHTKGIVVSSRAEGDSNKLVNVFTENFGLINAKVQGARNLHSKLRGGCQDFSLGEFSLIHGKTGWKVVSSRSEKNLFEVFKNSPEKLKMVGNILNLVKKLVSEESYISLATTKLEAKSGVFNIVCNFFNFLEKAKSQDIVLAECLTLLRILHVLGYMRHDPELSVPISSSEITIESLEAISPKRSRMIALINESLKAN
ncbi:MAG: recombination protein O N-terminal domain-containing protein [Candidatus Paceibacterota bacterium]|jgi:DNA repair protein RecO